MYNDQTGFFNKHLLSVNVNVFQYIFKLNTLFPPILKLKSLTTKAISNTKLGPVLCAVDDLNIYTNNEDPNHGANDIYDLLNNPTFYSGDLNNNKEFKFDFDPSRQVKGPKTSGYSDVHSVPIPTPPSQRTPQSRKFQSPGAIDVNGPRTITTGGSLAATNANTAATAVTDFGTTPSGEYINHLSASVSSQTVPQLDNSVQSNYLETLDYPSLSHFNLNMIGINQYYFNDFKPHTDNLDYSSSSNESYVSPLDDELFKRKFNKSSSLETEFANGGLYNDNANVPFNHDELDLDYDYDYDYDNELDFELDLPDHIKSTMNHKTPLPMAAPSMVKLEKIDTKKRKSTSKPITQKKSKLNGGNPTGNKFDKIDKSDAKFECSFCNAKFKVKGYLTRHLKKHQSFKAFKCPFYDNTDGASHISHGTANVAAMGKGAKCHPTGGFSRRDTYKTHLKALHFIYPPGTKSNERSLSSGRCGGCFKFFESNSFWLENHIEKKECIGTVKRDSENDQDNDNDFDNDNDLDQEDDFDEEDVKMAVSEYSMK